MFGMFTEQEVANAAVSEQVRETAVVCKCLRGGEGQIIQRLEDLGPHSERDGGSK